MKTVTMGNQLQQSYLSLLSHSTEVSPQNFDFWPSCTTLDKRKSSTIINMAPLWYSLQQRPWRKAGVHEKYNVSLKNSSASSDPRLPESGFFLALSSRTEPSATFPSTTIPFFQMGHIMPPVWEDHPLWLPDVVFRRETARSDSRGTSLTTEKSTQHT